MWHFLLYLFFLLVNQTTGTTTLGFKLLDGVILAVDSKASVGSYIGSRTVQKILPISSHIVGTMAGGAAGKRAHHNNLEQNPSSLTYFIDILIVSTRLCLLDPISCKNCENSRV